MGHSSLQTTMVYLHLTDTAAADAVDGVTYRREAFASAPDGVIVLRMAASRVGALNIAARLDSRLRFNAALYSMDYEDMQITITRQLNEINTASAIANCSGRCS